MWLMSILTSLEISWLYTTAPLWHTQIAQWTTLWTTITKYITYPRQLTAKERT